MFALLPFILSVAPQLASLVFGSSKAADTVAKVSGIVADITNTPVTEHDGGAAAVAALQADPAKMTALKQQLGQLQLDMQKELDSEAQAARQDALDSFKTMVADVANARALAVSAGPARWGAIGVSTVVMLLFSAKLIVPMFLTVPPIPEGEMQLLYAAVTLTLGFWLGSSDGSQRKNAQMSAMSTQLANSVPSSTAIAMLNAPSPSDTNQ